MVFRPPIILDTNVFVAAFFRAQSASRQLVDALAKGDLLLVWNQQTRAETETVLRSIPPIKSTKSAFSEDLFTAAGHYPHRTEPERFEMVADPSDRKFAALAEATGVVLISSDEDLLKPRRQMLIAILRPSEYLKRVALFTERDEDGSA